MTMNNVSIIIVNYNGRQHLQECLTSLLASDAASAEIILVDNASSDGSAGYVLREFPAVRVIPLDRNYGFAEANNIGAEAAAGEYLVFLNNDTVVTPDWLDALKRPLASDPLVGVTGCKLLFHDKPHRVNSAGAAILFNGAGYDIGFMEPDGSAYDVPGPRGAVCGAAMMVRKRDFASLGGFDAAYFMYIEDTDLCWRYWLRGLKVLYVPASVVYHKYGGTSGTERHSALRVFYSTRNSMLTVVKNYECRHLCFPLAVNMLYHASKLFLFCVTLRLKSAAAVLRAYASFFRQLPSLRIRRSVIQRTRQVSDAYLRKNGLIIPFGTAIREYLRSLNM